MNGYFKAIDQQNKEADYFAAAMLMPADEFKEVVKKYTNTDTNKVYMGGVAKHFVVSLDAAIYRGQCLGIIKVENNESK